MELNLSLARASCRPSFAARSCCPSCCLDQTRCLTLFVQGIRPNPRELMTRSSLRCRTSIIRSSALVQASSSLSMSRTRAWPRSLPITEIYFRHFSARVFSSVTNIRVLSATTKLCPPIFSNVESKLWHRLVFDGLCHQESEQRSSTSLLDTGNVRCLLVAKRPRTSHGCSHLCNRLRSVYLLDTRQGLEHALLAKDLINSPKRNSAAAPAR